MIVSIIGSNGMLSSSFSHFLKKKNPKIKLWVFGKRKPLNYAYDVFHEINLLTDKLEYKNLLNSDVIIYAAGAGVQPALQTPAELMYKLNLYIPINICNTLQTKNFKGIFISFGSYMEIGANQDETKAYNEQSIINSELDISNNYALSKRLLSRFMDAFKADYKYYHFILPNLFSKNESGTRLIPYVIEYLNKKRNGQECNPLKLSSGTQLRQYVNLEEVGEVIFRAITLQIPSSVYNIGGGEILSIRNLVTRIFSYYNLPIDESIFGKEQRRDGDIHCLKMNGDKLASLINFKPQLKIESIL